MDLIIDANIIFAVLIKDSISHELFFKKELHFYCSEFLFTEIEKHLEEILKKTFRTKEEFENLLGIIKKRIELVPQEELIKFVPRAKLFSPDPEDVVYFALALKLDLPIWSNDKALKDKQNNVKVYNTQDLLSLLKDTFLND